MTDMPEELMPDSATNSMEEQVELQQPYGEVTAEDLSTDDLAQDGADLLIEEPNLTNRLIDDARQDDPAEETIDQRLAQEEYDPTSGIVPGADVDVTEEQSIAEAEAEGALADVLALEDEVADFEAAASDAAADAQSDDQP